MALRKLILGRALTISILLGGGIALTGAFAQTGQARFSGSVMNSDGGPVSSAVVVLCNEDANLWFMTSTDEAGAFELTGLPANEFWIEVNAPQWRRNNATGVWGFKAWMEFHCHSSPAEPAAQYQPG